MSYQLIILGSNAAAPTSTRQSTAQLLNTGNHLFLIDCAEGTQMQLRRMKIRFQKINHIFISHLHGDHFFGLIGLVTTFHLLGREKTLHLYGPPELKEVIEFQLHLTQTTLIYPLEFHPTQSLLPELLFEDKHISVSSIPLLHRIPTSGFLFRGKPGPRKIRKEMIEGAAIPVQVFRPLQQGEDVLLDDGTIFTSERYTIDPPHPVSYAYCSDTGYFEPLIRLLEGVDHLFHESTFLHKEEALAREKQHSTARDAAMIATLSGVKKLYLGHFSSRYKDLDLLLREAREIFPDTQLAEEGNTFTLE